MKTHKTKTKQKEVKSLLSLMDVDAKKIDELISLSVAIKKNPGKYSKKLQGKTLLMIFQKPSLRTRISFEVAMNSLGGKAIVTEMSALPIGQKESMEDTAKVCSRYVDAIMARLFDQSELIKLKENSTIPVINGLTNEFHPARILSDLLTIYEKKKKLKGLKLCYLGDAKNNVTHCLLIGCAHMGIDISVACPKEMMPRAEIVSKAQEIAKKSKSNCKILITNDPKEAIDNADIVYTDSWMSYHILPAEKEQRLKALKEYQVNSEIVRYAKKDYIFMNCLPAMRGYEQTAEVMDGQNSIVFDQAENRLHMQKAILLSLLK
ncbi:MAG: ornithine carbamoyltransferase [Nanoarchaeota archaeon]|nr:ornithine carbamoyltransferase [Nanoarchaeota archaeon]